MMRTKGMQQSYLCSEIRDIYKYKAALKTKVDSPSVAKGNLTTNVHQSVYKASVVSMLSCRNYSMALPNKLSFTKLLLVNPKTRKSL